MKKSERQIFYLRICQLSGILFQTIENRIYKGQ